MLIDSLQFIAVFVALQFVALILCCIFLPVIPASIAVALAGALYRSRQGRPPGSRGGREPHYAQRDDLDMIAALQSMDDGPHGR